MVIFENQSSDLIRLDTCREFIFEIVILKLWETIEAYDVKTV